MRSITSFSYIPTGKHFKERCTSVKAWQLPKNKGALAPDHVWTNEDMDPVKKEDQTWTLWTWLVCLFLILVMSEGLLRREMMGIGFILGGLR